MLWLPPWRHEVCRPLLSVVLFRILELVLASGYPFQKKAPGTLLYERLRGGTPQMCLFLTCLYLGKKQEARNELKRIGRDKNTLTADILKNPNQKHPISDGSCHGTSGELHASTGDTTLPIDWVESRTATSGGGSGRGRSSLPEEPETAALGIASGSGAARHGRIALG